MLSSSTLALITLASSMLVLYGVQSVPPQNCLCQNPHNVGPNGTTPCNDTRCSRGDNLACTATDPATMSDHSAFSFTLYAVPDQSYFILTGCNCPGFKFNNGHGGENGYVFAGGENDFVYTYHNCSDFNPGVRSHNITRCCNYCCGPAHISPDT